MSRVPYRSVLVIPRPSFAALSFGFLDRLRAPVRTGRLVLLGAISITSLSWRRNDDGHFRHEISRHYGNLFPLYLVVSLVVSIFLERTTVSRTLAKIFVPFRLSSLASDINLFCSTDDSMRIEFAVSGLHLSSILILFSVIQGVNHALGKGNCKVLRDKLS